MKITTFPPLDGYRLKKAINADAATSAAGGVDGMMAFASANASPGSNMAQALAAAAAPPGGDFEVLVLLPWLQASANATPAGLGLSSGDAAAKVASLRAAAAQLPL